MQAAITAIRSSVWLRLTLLTVVLLIVGWFAIPAGDRLVFAYMFGPGLLVGAVASAIVAWITFRPLYAVPVGLIAFFLTTASVLNHPPNF